MNTTAPSRILVLASPNHRQSPVVAQLRLEHQVVIAETIEQALVELRDGSFDLIFSEAADFLPLERAVATQQSSLILDTIGEGICLTDQNGSPLWANRRMKMWPDAVRKKVHQICAEAHALFAGQNSAPSPVSAASPKAESATLPAPRSQKFLFNVDDTQFFEVVCSPIIDASRRVTQVVAICWDATSGRRLQQKIDAIDQAGREIVRLEDEAIAKLTVGERLKILEEKVIKYSHQLMHFDHFAIRLLDRRTNKLELVICVGLPTEAREVELFAKPEGNGISGYVASTGRSYICPDVKKDPRYVQGLHQAGSSLTVPLMLNDKTIGIFNVESQQFGAFTEDDRQFAEIFGSYVAMALNILNLLIVERHQTTGQLAKDVILEVTGPLNDIVSDTTLLMDEYIGDEDMRARLETILTNVNKVRQSIKSVGEGKKAILGVQEGMPHKLKDPILESKRVLVADDEPNIRQTIADLLTRYGCITDTAQDGAEAIALLAKNPRYDLVLTDIKMPHKNGYEIFAAAKKLNHSPPVILMTGFGYDPNHSIVRASQEGLAAVLFKPFRVEQLLGEVRKAISGVSRKPSL